MIIRDGTTSKAKSSVERNWGFSDLKVAEISASLGYLIVDGLGFPPEEDMRQIRIHDFQILCGDGQRCDFAFTSEMLSGQIWQASNELQIAEPSKAIKLTATATISAADFEVNSKFS